MSILVRESREDLVYGMRTALLAELDNGVLTESASIAGKNFILNEASYNELLNLVFNPDHDTVMESTEVLEKVACDVLEEGKYARAVKATKFLRNAKATDLKLGRKLQKATKITGPNANPKLGKFKAKIAQNRKIQKVADDKLIKKGLARARVSDIRKARKLGNRNIVRKSAKLNPNLIS